MRYWRFAVWGGVVVATVAVFAVAAGNGDLSDTAMLTTVLGFGISASGLALSVSRGEPQGSRLPPDEVLNARADKLAGAVQRQWQAEWRLRRLQDPEPIAVDWAAAAPWLADAPGDAEPADDSADITTLLERVASRRLVVLGEPGSGKTVMAIRFVLRTLERRASSGPVPVLFPLSDWQPQSEALDDWLARYVARHYPGASWARELLAAGRVIAVLDGLDEMSPPLRMVAVRRLNAELDDGRTLLLTCRSHVYEEVVQAGDVLTSAAAVELQSLPFEAAARYLQRTARPVRGPEGQRTTLWHPVIERLRSNPDEPSCRALREVMQTPLMVTLLRTAYEDPEADPAELLEGRWAERATLEAHLLDVFVPAAFRDDPQPLDRTLKALAFLAWHLERRSTRELAWWELRRELPWALREWGPVLLIGVLVMGIALWVAGPYGGWTIAIVTGLVAPVCAGQSVFLRTGGRISLRRLAGSGIPGEVVLAAGAIPLGLVVGVAGDLNGLDYALNPVRFQWAGGTAAALAGGLILTTALAVLGLLGRPAPHTAPLGAGERGRPWAGRLMGLVVVAGAAAFGVVIPAQFGLSGPVNVACGALAALAGIVAVWKNPYTTGNGSSARGQRVLPVIGWAMARGIAAGLLLGLGFGVADAAVLAGRAAAAPPFPPGGIWSTGVNGDRIWVTPDGWRHARLADGTRVALAPKAADWKIDHLSDGAVYAKTASETCDGTCQTVHRPVEFHLRPGHGGIRVKLADGSFADSYDMDNILPDATALWLIRGTPSALFAKASWTCVLIGLCVGLLSGAAAALHRWLITPSDVTRLGTPWDGLRADRATAVSRGALLTAIALLAAFALRGPGESIPDIVSGSPFVLLIVAPFAVLLSAWGWFLITRLWLCTTGRLPWRLMHFLDEAHRRGVLRQTGAFYEFRHARLQERLASGGDGSRPVQPPFTAS